ncbi:MAG: glycosyltransferase [Melioribacteraceae bacterium]|nr:glycosyltransferase [Melioribacteraceae bacterium]MCF8352872.1 glycosyltransferase [Melioribacteraceae bacterium]MCF8393811.1 glycosyltransferase [Melioribacteraceae bacterium]MCF8417389.1 glycosyltransferase [Melioribacteraceae bacterium]
MSELIVLQFSFGEGYSGSAKVALEISKILENEGFKTVICVSKDSLTEKRALESGSSIAAYDTRKDKKSLFDEIYKDVLELKPDFIISHHSLDRKVGAYLKKKLKKEIINIGYRHNETKSFPIIGALKYNMYFDSLIACSGGVERSLIKSGIKRKKVKLIYNGINIPDNINEISGDSIRKEFNLEGKYVLGTTSWFHKERKGFDILFHNFTKLSYEYVLLLAGIVQKEEVYDFAAEYGISKDRIIMPGYIDNIWEYYKAFDLFLLPSRSEGFPLVLLEAAAAKTPIIASNISGSNEFISNMKNGLLFDLNDDFGLKDKITELIENSELKEKFVNAAYEKVMSNFTVKHYQKNLSDFLLSLKN